MAETTSSAPVSRATSPEPQRAGSPSPSVSPSLALDAVPLLDRSVSTPSNSSSSTLSTRSRQSRLSDGATVVKRRGYMRPQGTAFADSARNRDSVMSLGSIAHMQYYFARTGLLDGKGGQLAKDTKKTASTTGTENQDPSQHFSTTDELGISSLSLYDSSSNYAVSDPGHESSMVESPTDIHAPWSASAEPPMLPPTVSTYKQKPSYTEPLPDIPVLRRELKEALQDACKCIEESQQKQEQVERDQQHATDDSSNNDGNSGSDGYHEIQGLHILDILTLAIRAAKNYYTAHPRPDRLYTIRSERAIRGELYQVLDVLKRMASRNFRGGMRLLELAGMVTWIESIDQLVKKEEALEAAEQAERESWTWLRGAWSGKEEGRRREWLFLKSFDPELPVDGGEEACLKVLRDGVRLCKLHNSLVMRSQRHFDLIKSWHEDVGKPYRRAENLRYWIKAAELRWEIKLHVPVSEVVGGGGIDEESGGSREGLEALGDAVVIWARAVREELMEEWRVEERTGRGRAPELRVVVPGAEDDVS